MRRSRFKRFCGNRFGAAPRVLRVALVLVMVIVMAGAPAAALRAQPPGPAALPPSDDILTPKAAAAMAALNVEEIYYKQDALLASALDRLQPQRPGRVDLYFLGFAGFAYQDVFLKEVRSARALFDAAYGTKGRSLLLVNNLETLSETPVASAHNLQTAVNGLGRAMDPDEDVAVIFLTSHGAPERLSVEFGPLGLNDLSPTALRSMLDAAGIGWRVIIVSACYSGGFIDALKSDRTLIMTAARADRASFGCTASNRFTYFGEALFDQALRRGGPLIAGFRVAANSIAERERNEGLRPSLPQLVVGDAIAAKLPATPLARP